MSFQDPREMPHVQKEVDKIFNIDRPSAWKNNRCIEPPIGCGKPITGFRDAPFAREYRISGMCQKCQDDFEAMMDEE